MIDLIIKSPKVREIVIHMMPEGSTEEEIEEATENYKDYLKVVWNIAGRITDEQIEEERLQKLNKRVDKTSN